MRWILVSLLSFFMFCANAQEQISTTGNLVNFGGNPTASTSTWQNVGQFGGQLTCWGPGGPGYCGPLPYVNANGYGSINFSYGLADLHEIVNVAKALPDNGTGLRVNGFNFGFTAKNGNGWDDGRVDYLKAYVYFYDPSGKLVEKYDYDLNYKFNWTTFNYIGKFTNPYSAGDLGTARFGFIGRDNNYWAGPYGPEVVNVSFSLNYSVDPCASNPLYSPTCPGFQDALNKLTQPTLTTPSTTTFSTTTPTTTVSTTIVADPTNPTVTTTITTLQPQTTAISTANAISMNKQETKSTNGTSIGLSVIAKNQQKEQAIATQASQNAITTANVASSNSQQEASQIATQAVTNSVSSNTGSSNQSVNTVSNNRSVSNTTQNQANNSSMATVQGPTQSNMMQSNKQENVEVSIVNSFTVLPMPNSNGQTQQNFVIQEQIAPPMVIQNKEQKNTQTEVVIDNNQNNFTTNRTNPITEIVEGKTNNAENTQQTRQGSNVNKNVENNSLANGVDITRMATAPRGYADYMSFNLKDADFYPPKEVYNNQKNVDNVRLLRQLSSDRLHQQMVEQQYRR